MKAHLLSITAMSVILSACGGGGSDSGPPEQAQNTPPIVDLSSQFEAPENSSFEITASASDSDGSISGYEWTVVDGGATIASGAGSKTVSLTLPAVEEDKNVTVKVRVTDNGGKSTEAQTEILVEQVVPEVSAPESVSSDEKAVIELAADVAVASGNIASVQWSAADDSGITFTDATLADTSATLPSVSEKTTTSVSITVTDNDGDSVTTTTSVVIEPITIALTLEGATGSTPVTNAGVTLLLDGNALTTDDTIATDSDGHFTANVDIDDDLTDALVSVKVAGVEEQAHVSLISHLDSVNGLLESAGDDHSLSYTVFPNLTVSEYTTAKHAVMRNIVGEINSEEAFHDAANTIGTDNIIFAASAIKVLVDRTPSAGYTVPSSFTDILTFAENYDVFSAFIRDVISTFEGNDARIALFDTPSFAQATFETDAAFSFYPVTNDINTTFTAERIFNADGTGQTDTYPMYWTKDGAQLIIKTDDGMTYEEREHIGEWVTVTYSDISASFTLLYDNGDTQDVLYVEHNVGSFYSMQYDREFTAPRTFREILTVSKDKKAMPDTLPSEIYLSLNPYFEIYEFDDLKPEYTYYRDDKFTINDDGTATGQYTDNIINWSLEEDKLVLTGFDTSYEDDMSSMIVEMVDNSSVGNKLLQTFVRDNGELVKERYNVVRGFIEETKIVWSVDNVPGIYGYPETLDEPIGNDWLEFSADYMMKRVVVDDRNEDGEVSENELTVQSGTWEISEKGELLFTLFTSKCMSVSEECDIYRTYTWKLLDKNSTDVMVFQNFIQPNYNADYTSMSRRTIYKAPPIDISGLDYQAILKNSRNKEVSLSKPDMLR